MHRKLQETSGNKKEARGPVGFRSNFLIVFNKKL